MLSPKRWTLLLIALALVAISWWRVADAARGLTVRSFEQEGLPLLYVAPETGDRMPGVLVAHGFAGSKQLMLGYAHVLARAGYAVMLWDFGGHGANSAPLASDTLQQDLNRAYDALLEQPGVDGSRVALLGHSMGSGAVMEAAIRHPDRYAATVAVSPTGAEVTPSAPRNLLLQAGSWEGRFVANAERLLERAGGASDLLEEGTARRLLIVPNAEHITILFRDESHQSALAWLNDSFGLTPAAPYYDRRMGWYGLHLLAWLLALVAVAPLLRCLAPGAAGHGEPGRWRWIGLLVGPIVAMAALAVAGRFVALESLGGLLVGSAVALWILVAGLVWLAGSGRFSRPSTGHVVCGALLFALLWIAVGAMAQAVWLQWWLNAPRALLWPLLSLAAFPWFLAAGLAQEGSSAGGYAAWWLAQTIALAVGLAVTALVVPGIGFIFLLLPLFPVILGVLSVAASQVRSAWPYAIAAAPFFGWLLAAAFPLSG